MSSSANPQVTPPAASVSPFRSRLERVRSRLLETNHEVALISVGADLPWLTGYEAMPLERLTMLVVTRDAPARLIVPALERPRVREQPDVFDVCAYGETEDPVGLVAEACGGARRVVVGDRTWARFVVDLLHVVPGLHLARSGPVIGPLRAVKDPHELDCLSRASAAADVVAQQLQRGEIPLVGRTEAQVSADIGRRLLDVGHHRVNFAIVAGGENAASPHHEPGGRVIRSGEVVLCDFGGTYLDEFGVGYCSDITRCVWTGEVPESPRRIYDVLSVAQELAVQSAVVGETPEAVDAAARRHLVAAGLGDAFIHRTGHGIGVEEHEDPFIVTGNRTPLLAGNVFSVEPGVYLPGSFGFRLEDIVAAESSGPRRLNRADRRLIEVA